MKKKVTYSLTLLVLILIASSGSQPSQASSTPIQLGPYTRIELPLEDLPQPHPALVFNPVINQFPSGAELQVLQVVNDPRDVPPARFAYYSNAIGSWGGGPLKSGVVSHVMLYDRSWDGSGSGTNYYYQDQIEAFNNSETKTVNIYLRVTAPAGQSVIDPIFGDYFQDQIFGNNISTYHTDGGRPNLYIYWMNQSAVSPSSAEDSLIYAEPERASYLCAVPEYANGTKPYQLPPEIDGGEAVTAEGLYDPAAFSPPQPWYYGDSEWMSPGEVREGWISCLAPEVPLEELQVRVRYDYTQPPEPTPTPGPSPTPWPTVDVTDCVVLENPDDLCEAACCTFALPTLDATESAYSQQAQQTAEAERYLPKEKIGEKIAWAYASAAPFPEGGYRLDNVPLAFWNEQTGEELSDTGSVTFHNMRIFSTAGDAKKDNIQFAAEITVLPAKLSPEALKEYQLSGLGVEIEFFNSPTAGFQNSSEAFYSGPSENPDQVIDHQDSHRIIPSFLWDLNEYLLNFDQQGNLIVDSRVGKEDDWGRSPSLDVSIDPAQARLWININPEGFSELSEYSAKQLVPIPITHLATEELVSSTAMCDRIKCQDVNEADQSTHRSRTMPVLCAGEWANGLVIDGQAVEQVEFIGETSGLLVSPYGGEAFLKRNFIKEEYNIIQFEARLAGGIKPWWNLRNTFYERFFPLDEEQIQYFNRYPDLYLADRYDFEEVARAVDRKTGQGIDSELYFLPFFENSRGQVYLSMSSYQTQKGWLPDLVENNFLIFQIMNDDDPQQKPYFMLYPEGPLWDTDCSRDQIPELASAASYTAGTEINLEGLEAHQMTAQFPGMVYPPSELIIPEDPLALGDPGRPIFQAVVYPSQVKIVQGNALEASVYVPEEDRFYPMNWDENIFNQAFFAQVDAQLIPPNASLVMVKIEKDDPQGAVKCYAFNHTKLQLIYPGFYPITSEQGAFTERAISPEGFPNEVCTEDFSDQWIYFKFPSLNLDQSQLLLSIADGDAIQLWQLSEE